MYICNDVYPSIESTCSLKTRTLISSWTTLRYLVYVVTLCYHVTMTHIDIKQWLASDNSQHSRLATKSSSDGSSSITLPKLPISRQDEDEILTANSRQQHSLGEVDWGFLPTLPSNKQLVPYQSDRPTYVYVDSQRSSHLPPVASVTRSSSSDLMKSPASVIMGRLSKGYVTVDDVTVEPDEVSNIRLITLYLKFSSIPFRI